MSACVFGLIRMCDMTQSYGYVYLVLLAGNLVRTQVPVFLMGILIGGKKYDWTMYFQVAVVTAGVVVFNFGFPPPLFSLKMNKKDKYIHI